MLGASVAAIGINILVAITCLFVRFVRERRDWLTPLALAHLFNAGVYLIAALYAGPERFNVMIVSWTGVLFLALQTLNPLFVLLAVLRLHERRVGGMAEIAILLGGAAAVACLWLPGAVVPAFATGQGIGALVYIVVGCWLCRGPTVFYRVVGATFAIRGLYGCAVVFFSQIHRDVPVLEMLIYLNVIFVTASGFGSLLIEFDDTRRELAIANAAKTDFLANMSHELRTPLNAILGFGQVIEGAMIGPLPDRYRQYARDILSAGNHLLGIVDQLLNMAVVEHRGDQLQLERACAKEIVADSIQMLRTNAVVGTVRLRTDLPESEVPIVTDVQALRQIVLNLVNNAIKFSPPRGEVRVALTADTDTVLLTVIDEGPGISKEDQKKIFSPFWQAERSRSRQYRGIGLGLAVTDRLARALGATITVRSTPGAGSSFRVLLPRGLETG
jgi:signal transduction histidine kinase